ncbi:MAG: HIT family protein [Bacteroidia bacterium]|nr:HIT family protein [Bacteroidia bacterium]
MSSIFSKIIAGQIPCYKVAESEHCLAFLDINPLTKGHLLVIPKVEIDYIFDLEDKHYLQLHLFTKTVAIALKKAIKCNRVGVTVIGLEVPHAHIHLIPINDVSDMNFSNKKLTFSKDEFLEIANSIATFL